MPSFSRNLEESLHRAVAYANQTERDYIEFTKAVRSGRIDARAD